MQDKKYKTVNAHSKQRAKSKGKKSINLPQTISCKRNSQQFHC